MAGIPRRRLALTAALAAGLALLLPVLPAAAATGPGYHLHSRSMPRQDAPAGAAAAFGNCSSCSPPLLFGGSSTPVMGGISHTSRPVGQATLVPIYWAPSGFLYTTNYKSIVNQYIADVAADSGKESNVYSVATEYYQTYNGPTQFISYSISAGAAVDDADSYPLAYPVNSQGCLPNAGALMTACVTDTDLQNELLSFINSHGLPKDDTHIYMVMFPNHVETCQGAGSENVCSTNAYCAYHSGFIPGFPNIVLYGNEPFPDLNGCTGAPHAQQPNGDTEADTVISSFSHEVSESITDAFGAWMDANGFENGDECAYTYGNALGGSSGTYFNQVINGHHYWTQMEFSNRAFANNQGMPFDPTHPTIVPGCLQNTSPVPGPRGDGTSPAVSPGAFTDVASPANSPGSRTATQGAPRFSPTTGASAAATTGTSAPAPASTPAAPAKAEPAPRVADPLSSASTPVAPASTSATSIARPSSPPRRTLPQLLLAAVLAAARRLAELL